MRRPLIVALLLAVAAGTAPPSLASAANVWVSLNLQFNTPGNPNSGGAWTAVAKAEPQGLAGISMYLANANFGSFLAPPQLEVRAHTGLGATVSNVVVGDNLDLPLPLGIGVIGSSFPSTYVDPAGIAPFGGSPDFGSFTGGVALATGTFNPGLLPAWTTDGANFTDANLFIGPDPPAVDADVLLTVRAVRIPEPAAIWTSGALAGVVFAARGKRRSTSL
jgi:hypothetical protein